jgi:hypothetical protein
MTMNNRNDRELNELLAAYTVAPPRAEHLETTRQKAQAAHACATRGIPTRPFSLWTQIRVQATYLSKWFYLSCIFIALLGSGLSAVSQIGTTASVFFGVSPLFIVPCAAMLYQAASSGMLELEAACKYSMAKLFTGKLMILGAVVSVLLLVMGILHSLMAGVVAGSAIGLVLRPLLLSFISFTWAAALVLWFGKRSLWRGLACGALWEAATLFLVVGERGRVFLETVNIGLVWLAFLFTVLAGALSALRFIRNISFEGVCEEWNFSLTA